MMEENCFSPCSHKLTSVVRLYLSWVTVQARDDVEVRLQAPQTKTKHFCVCVCVCMANRHLEKLHHY